MSRNFLLVLGASILVPLIAITGESLWIDELMSAFLITAESTEGFKDRAAMLNTSDIQMPLYMFYVYLWENVFGSSEWAMRLANLPWFVFGVGSLWHLLRDTPRVRLLSCFLVIVSPFAWYYLNEVRPYAMQLGASCAVVGCATRVLWSGRPLTTLDLVLTTIGLIGMAGASLLSVPWIGMFFVVIGLALLRGKLSVPRLPAIMLGAIAGVLLFGLAIYYLKTLSTGARAATAGGGIIQGLGFSFYELFGFAGLGPGRTELRQIGISVFKIDQLAAIGLLVFAYAATAFAFLLGKPDLKRWKSQLIITALLIALPMVFFLLLGFLRDFRVLGRHLAPLLPVICVILGGMLANIRSCQARLVTSGCLVLLLLASAVSIRIALRHKRDDYRQASQFIVSEFEKRRNVLYVANLAGLAFYGPQPDEVPRRSIEKAGIHVHLFGRGDGTFLPETVLISKPEIHDPTGYARQFLNEGKYRLEWQFPGFQVWVR